MTVGRIFGVINDLQRMKADETMMNLCVHADTHTDELSLCRDVFECVCSDSVVFVHEHLPWLQSEIKASFMARQLKMSTVFVLLSLCCLICPLCCMFTFHMQYFALCCSTSFSLIMLLS